MTGSLQLLESFVAQINVQTKAIVDLIVFTLVVTIFTVVIFRYYGKGGESYTKRIKKYFSNQHISKWLLKCLYAIVLLFVAHYLINSMLTPFIEPYYNGRYANILKVSRHAEGVKYVSMVVHALVMVIGFQPLFALWKGSKTSLLFWFGFPLFIILALQPFVFNLHWPLGFRFPLFIEETLIMYIHAIILVHLFYVPDEAHKEEEILESKLSMSNW
jgi:magnesium-transporting ATPase (P-type)